MMKLKAFNLFFLILTSSIFSQNSVKCLVTLGDENQSDIQVKVYEKNIGYITQAKINVPFVLDFDSSRIELIFVLDGYPSINKPVDFENNKQAQITVEFIAEQLSEVILSAKRKEVFLLKRMDDFEKTEIYAGKK